MNPTTVLCALVLACSLASPVSAQPAASPAKVRIAIAGLAHGHLDRIVRLIKASPDVELVGLFDADPALHALMAERYALPRPLFHGNLNAMLDATKPQAVAAFGTTFDHKAVVQAAARRGIHVMMEKPLAVSVEHGNAIRDAARTGKIHVIVNYETTWYPSHAAIWKLMKEQAAGGDIRKMVAMDGHEGPKEIGVGPEFLEWLSDPMRNGGGALFDFGCYGANLMTWLMDNQRPLSVTARVQQIKPDIYPKVDDEATIVVEYPKAQGIIEASWNWPFGRKDLEVYGAKGYAIATGGGSLRVRLPGKPEAASTPAPMPPDSQDELAYFVGVIRGTVTPSGLSSLENNLIVTEILEAARESARTGKTVQLRKGL
jgi:predicted dehydrogenase